MEEYGVGYQRLVAGDNKDIGTPFRTLANSEEELLQGKLDLIHDYFIDAVAQNRGLERMAVDKAATGEFYLGVEALDLGLIDELGDLDNAKAYLLENESIEVIGIVEYGSSESILDILFGLSLAHGSAMGETMGSKIVAAGSSVENSFSKSGVLI